MSKNPSPRADHLRAMREAQFSATTTAARLSGEPQPPAAAEPAPEPKAKQKTPSPSGGKAKKPKGKT